jgi:outer membrane protein TolC
LLVIGFACAATQVAAADRESPAPIRSNPDSALALTLERLPGEPLALASAVREALARATAVQVARAELAAAQGALRREGGAFQPELYGEAVRSSDSTPTASFFSGADVLEGERTDVTAGARYRLPFGTELAATLNTTRQTTNSNFATLSPQYDTYGELSLVQPLLRGFGPGSSGERDAAAAARAAAEANYADARLATQSAVETVYWAIYAAERDFAVQSLIRDQAAAFLDEVRLRARAGVVGPAEEANARVFLAQQEQAVLDSEEALDRLSDRLATLLGRRPAQGAERFRPADRPPVVVQTIDERRLIAVAEANSRQLRAAENALAAARARADGADRNALPQLDLVGTLGGRGLAGTGREIVLDFGDGPPDTIRNDLDTGFGDSFDQVVRRNYPTWSVGMMFSIPIGGGGNAGERDRLRAEVVRAEQDLEAVRRTLEETVRTQFRELERGRLRLELAQQGVDASLEQVRIGTLQYDTGRTTAFEVVRLAADLADAQRRYSAALVRTASAAATLRRLTAGAFPGEGPVGSILEESTP